MRRGGLHTCARRHFPFLAGVGIRLQYERAGPTRELSRFLATRGVWLVFLDLTVVSAALNFGRPFFFVQVLYATGVSMTAMAAIVWDAAAGRVDGGRRDRAASTSGDAPAAACNRGAGAASNVYRAAGALAG
jgi:hypothetical protein